MKRRIFSVLIALIIGATCAAILVGCGGGKNAVSLYDGDKLLSSEELTLDSDFKVASPSKKGYVFLGWYLEKALENRITDEKGASLAPYDGSFTNLYAGFQAYDVVVTLNVMGGVLQEGTNAQIYTKYGEAFSESLPVPTKSGYVFDGWQGKADILVSDKVGTIKENAKILTSEHYNVNEADMSVVLKAIYSLRRITISFDTLGGVAAPDITAQMFSNVLSLPISARSNDYFVGWKKHEADSDIVKLPLKITADMADTVLLTASYVFSESANSLIYAEINEGSGYEISYFSDTGTALVIPDMHKGLPILRIKRIVMPLLTELTIASSVTEIATDAFKGCNSLENISLPSFVEKIGASAFEGLEKLEKVEIKEGVTTIGAYAFKDCPLLKEINLPLSLEVLKEGVFAGTADGLVVTLPKTITKYKFENGLLYNINGGELLLVHCADRASEVITVDAATREVGAYAFYGTTQIKTIKFPSAIRAVGKSAFSGMTGLITIELSGDTTIGSEAFKDCVSLKAIFLNSEIPRAVGENAFQGCSDFLSVFVPDVAIKSYIEDSRWSEQASRIYAVSDNYNGFILRKVKDSLNEDCYMIVNYVGTDTNIILPSIVNGRKIISINTAFSGMAEIETVTISENITTINENAFKGCTSLKAVIFKSTFPPTVSATSFDGTNDTFIMYTQNDMAVYNAYYESVYFAKFAVLNRLKTI